MSAFSGFLLPRRRLLDDVEYSKLSDDQLQQAGLAEPSESAPTDFGGAVLPNPTHIRAQWDTDPIPETRLPNGVSFKKDAWRGSPTYDISNPSTADVLPDPGREIKADFSSSTQKPMGAFNIPQGTDLGTAFNSDPQNRKRLLQMVMGSDASATMDPPQADRIADDTSRHPAGFEPEPGSTEDLESRASSGRRLVDQIRQQPAAQPSRLDQLQSQYDQMKPPAPPKPLKWYQKILLGLGGVNAVNAEYGREARQQEFEEGRYDRQRQSLAQQIEDERRMQEQNELADQRDTAAYQRQLQSQREQDLRTPPKTIDTDQGLVSWNPQTRGWDRVSVNGQPVGPKASPKPDSLQAQYDEALQSGNAARAKTLLQEIRDLATAGQKPEQPQRPQQMLGVTPDHKVIEIRPGMDLPEGTQTIGGEIKAQQGQEGKNTAINYANDYLGRGTFTGPGDEALMEKFFEMAKPTSGFRMTEAQISMLKNARGWLGSWQAQAHHALYGSYFSDEQRQQIVDTMNELGQSGGNSAAAGQGGNAELKPPRDPKPNMKWQHRTINGKTEWREVAAQ